MESINFAGVLWRSWRLLLALALVGAVIGVLLPVSHVKQPKPILHWKAVALVGAAPRGGNDLVGGGVTAEQVVFYGNSLTVQTETAKAAHQDINAFYLPRYMSAAIGEPKSGSSSSATTTPTKANAASNVVTLTAYGRTKDDAVELVNYYVDELGEYIGTEYYAQQQYLDQTKAADKPTTTKSGAAASSTTPSTTPSASGSGSGSSGATGTATQAETGYNVLYYASQATAVPPVNGGVLDTHKVRLLVGFLLGAVLGAIIAVARVMLDKRIRTASQAANGFGFPVIVEIPARPPVSADERAAPVDVAMQPGSVEAEAFRMLRMSVLFEGLADTAAVTDPLALALGGNGHGAFGATVPAVPELARRGPGERHIVLIASPSGEETRPVVAANLAAVYAEAGQRVIVASTAELGVGQPAMMGNSEGLLSGDIHPVDVEARLQPTRVDNVVRLPFTMFLRNSGQLVTRGKELLDAARSVSDVIIVETPDLLSLHHAEALSHTVDVVVVVGECGTTRIADARKASELLRRIGSPVLGVVLTSVRTQGRVKPSPVTAPIGPVAVPSDLIAPANGAVSPAAGWEEPTAKTQV
jgi:Mrp family chromosome partitioning ATPase